MESNLRRLLDLVIPFRFLPSEEKDRLVGLCSPLKTAPFEVIFSEGAKTKEIYLLEDGQVELIYDEAPFVKPANVVRPGHYFGERAALLDQVRSYGARAVTPILCWSLPAESLLDLIRRYNVFAQAFGTILRDKHGIFLPLEHFAAEVASSLAQGYFRMEKLISLYRALEPAMHPHLAQQEVLDTSAMSYAIRRLPENVTTTFSWYFTDDIPVLYSDPGTLFETVATSARRRNVWQMLPGKNMVLLRNGMSDILDFLTCLCLFAIESQKIRRRLHDPGLLKKLQVCHDKASHDEGFCTDPEDVLEQLDGFPFTEEEAKAFHALWGKNTLQRLYELTLHHEDWSLAVERQLNNYNSRRSEKWANLVSKGVKEFMGIDPWNLPDELEVHIVSSNTHSVTNCLSPYPRLKADSVLDWARAKRHPFLDADWENSQDLVYGLLAEYMKEDPSRVPTPQQEAEWGIFRLDDQATTGIAVQLIDTARLEKKLDDSIQGLATKRKLIVNIDYAFGVQAEEIIRNLITLFHRRIQSVNILGKAGSLVGKRGDILVPTAFILQSDDSFHPLPMSPNLKRLRSRLKNAKVFTGPMLTVEGTLLQNRALLNFYRNIWKCLGLEMEGVFYARQVIESVQLDVLGSRLAQRYYYYVSDLPLDSGAQLSKPLSPADGIPPLYAITREILTEIFSDS